MMMFEEIHRCRLKPGPMTKPPVLDAVLRCFFAQKPLQCHRDVCITLFDAGV